MVATLNELNDFMLTEYFHLSYFIDLMTLLLLKNVMNSHETGVMGLSILVVLILHHLINKLCKICGVSVSVLWSIILISNVSARTFTTKAYALNYLSI